MLSPDNPALNDIETPALVIDRIALEQNIARMADTVRSHGLGLRPHAKTHKSDQIARLQIAAGAIGVSCATVLEAEALSKAAIDGLLITAPMMGSAKFERLARLHRSRPLMVVVDHIAQVEELSQALKPSDPHLGVLVDIDIGQARTGVTAIANAISLAMAISAAPQMTFAGIQGYAGHSQHIPDPVQRRASAQTAARLLSTYVTALTPAA